jgi:uncharacterized membrane protein
MGGMWIFWILLLVVLVLVVRWAVVGFRQGGSTGITGGDGIRTPETPEDVVKKRYARGEISKEELDSKLQDVRG